MFIIHRKLCIQITKANSNMLKLNIYLDLKWAYQFQYYSSNSQLIMHDFHLLELRLGCCCVVISQILKGKLAR